MQSGFQYSEARDMLDLAYAADLLGPQPTKSKFLKWLIDHLPEKPIPVQKLAEIFSKFLTHQLKPTDDPNNPIPDDNGTKFPYPDSQVWPAGWTPALPGQPWEKSIATSSMLNGIIGMNNAIVAYNESLDTYCVTFAGTENLPGGLEDLAVYPVSPGPIDIKFGLLHYQSNENYMATWPVPTLPVLDPRSDLPQPRIVEPKVHLGFRYAVETLTSHAKEGESIVEILRATGKKEMNLYITGHSLGAAMASLFSAWLQAGGMPDISFNLKTYTFACPKTANYAFNTNYNTGLTLQGLHFMVNNSLDTVPQIPFTLQGMNSLNNPNIITDVIPSLFETLSEWYDKLPPMLRTFLDNLDLDYGHAGSPISIQGPPPVVYESTVYPPQFFPGIQDYEQNPVPLGSKTVHEWWQHWPAVYRYSLDHQFGQG